MGENKLIDVKDASNELLNSLTHGEIKINESIGLIKAFLEEKPIIAFIIAIRRNNKTRYAQPECAF